MAVLRTGAVRFGAVAMAMALAGCSGGAAGSGGGSGDAGSSSVPSSAVAAGVELDPQMQEFLALDLAGQEAALAELSAKLERELWTETGMEAELGGPAATDKAYNALATAFTEQALRYRGDPAFGRFGAHVAAGSDDVSLGGLTFGGYVIAGLAAKVVESSNEVAPGKTQTSTISGEGTSGEISGSLQESSFDSTIEKTVDGVTGKLRTKVTIAPCPDATGTFTSKVLIDASSTTSGGRSGSNMTTEVDVTGHVDDSAELAGYESVTRTQAAGFKSSKGAFVDVTTSVVWSGGQIAGVDQTYNRTGGAATGEMLKAWGFAGVLTEALVNHYALDAAEKAWKSGRCVDLKATTTPSQRTGLKPSTAVSILAQPVSKIDGKPVGGTVTATLAGESSVDPAGSPVPADATFAYVAPGEKDKTASVSLESRSKRGIGKVDVAFDTKAVQGWAIDETQTPYRFTGVSCTSEKGPWVIDYAIQGVPGMVGGGVIKVNFPGDPAVVTTSPLKAVGTDKGEFKAAGLPGGVRFAGAAKATLTPSADAFTMGIRSGGSATGYARSRSRTMAWPESGFTLKVQQAPAGSCPSPG